MSTGHAPDRLTEEQRKTVEQNLKLVSLQIKRLLGRGGGRARAPLDWDELFQEGCVGLVQAVRGYRPDSGMSFSTYALPRIYHAVCRALHRSRQIIRLPERLDRARPERERGREAGAKPDPHRKPRRAEKNRPVRVWSLTSEELSTLPDKPNPWAAPHDPLEGDGARDPVTLGTRLREKLRAAVDEAVEHVGGSSSARGDRRALARRLAEERVLVPEVDYQTSLREIARMTGSSYGRVASCETRLFAEVRRLLSTDLEVELLRSTATRRSDGLEAPLDDVLRQAVREGVTQRVLAGFASLPPAQQADILLDVLRAAGKDLPGLLRSYLGRLGEADLNRLATRLSGTPLRVLPAEGSH